MSTKSTKHTPQIRLQAAQARYKRAHEECPHWDYVGEEAGDPYACCYEAMDAVKELRDARKAMTHE